MTAIHAFARRHEPVWLACRSCGYRDGDRCTNHDAEIRWPMDWYGCGDYCAGDPVTVQTTLEGWE